MWGVVKKLDFLIFIFKEKKLQGENLLTDWMSIEKKMMIMFLSSLLLKAGNESWVGWLSPEAKATGLKYLITLCSRNQSEMI